MNDQLDRWLVVYMNGDCNYNANDFISKSEVESEVKMLVREGVKPELIRIFPPNRNITATELLLYEE